MNFCAQFIAHHNEYKEIYLIPNFFKSVSFLEKNSNIVNLEIIRNFENDNEKIMEKTALLLLGEINDDNFSLLQSIPISNAILCENKTTKFSNAEIWEKIREKANHIVISKNIDDFRNDVLDWTKNQANIDLSIILPVYNVEKYLAKCIQTITAWDFKNLEFIFIDDGSTDKSSSVIEDYMKTDNRIKLFHKENGGCASARQFGLEKALGTYVGFVDPDDFIDPSMFRKLLFSALDGSYEISYCGYNEFYENSGKSYKVPDTFYPPYCFGTTDKRKINFLIAFTRVAIWRFLYNKDFLIKNKIEFHTSLRRFDDLPFKIETLFYCRSIIGIDEHLYFYRLQRQGQDVSANDERLYVHFEIFKILDELFKNSINYEVMGFYYLVKLNTHMWAYSKIKEELKDAYCSLAIKDLCSFENANVVYKKLSKFINRKQKGFIKKLFKFKQN